MNRRDALIEPELLSAAESERFVGAPAVLRVLRLQGLIVPVVNRSKLVLYRVAHLRAAVDWIEKNGLPTVREARQASTSTSESEAAR